MNYYRNMQKEYYYEEIEEIDLSDKKAYLMIKRVLDILLSSVSLIVAIPIILITSIFIKLESKGPAFFKQERSGLNGKSFNIYKLRSMSTDAEKNGPQWASKDDNRVTKVGKFIRKTRIDELPQLFNVFKGDMTIFGPRPERPIFVEQFSKEIPGFDKRTIVKPGLTGWAQVNGGYDISPEDKLKLDLFYIRNMSLALDFKIMLKTVKVVLTGEGAR
ncbi:UDP-phosphate N-acetylgalactosaminyl-1-phosphate transferase [Metabacillus indicus LMG 22858]|nr:UDP-phosphate N-acetylgalactosaminyl-1-phosphate transferase [Metabacillus indicus LMG 22858]